MDIKEIQLLKAETEIKIRQLLISFEEKCSVNVQSIDLTRIETTNFGFTKRVFILNEVDLNISL